MKKYINKFLSIEVAVYFLLIFALSSAFATFIENDFGTASSKVLVYNTKWFEFIMFFLTLCVVYNMFRFKLYASKKFFIFIFHISFVFIFIGAGLTRYMGYEGVMHIREGEVDNKLLSFDEYISIKIRQDGKTKLYEQKVISSPLKDINFNEDFIINSKKLNIKYKDFILSAKQKAVFFEGGSPIISFLVSKDKSSQALILKDKTVKNFSNIIFSLNKVIKTTKPYINFYIRNNKFYFKSSKEISWFEMKTQKKGVFKANNEYLFTKGKLYSIDDINFSPSGIYSKGIVKVYSKDNSIFKFKSSKLNAMILELEYDGKKKEIALFGRGKAYSGKKELVNFKDFFLELSWGAKTISLPFSLKLLDFNLNRYPGSASPSSYSSDLILLDKANNISRPVKIYMNNPLDYGGFRFFQSSYDRDERGTVLSVNKDPGKIVTYIGYFLLFFGMSLNFFNVNSRFRKLLAKTYDSKNFLLMFIVPYFLSFNILKADEKSYKDILNKTVKIDKVHTDVFAKLLVQDIAGRIKPIDSLTVDLLNKISRTKSLFGFDSNQIFLAMIIAPRTLQKIPMIKFSHNKIKEIVGTNTLSKRFAFVDAFVSTKDGTSYKFADFVDIASRKKPSNRTKFDEDILKVDERLNIAYMIYTGSFLRVFPKKGHSNNKWFDPQSAVISSKKGFFKDFFNISEANDISQIMKTYFDNISEGLKSSNWAKANNSLFKIIEYQKKYYDGVLPSQFKIDTEIYFNKFNILERLTPFYLLIGFILLILTFIKILNNKININIYLKYIFYSFSLLFIAHTIALLMRWYISAHAPWSNGYESMIYIAWAISLAGLIFARQSYLALSASSILAGIALFVAHLSWMDPQITNLVPVLKSYWLTIHVSIITGSYGFFALSFLLGFIMLVLYILLAKDKNSQRYKSVCLSIKEAGRINEMSMILGLTLLTIGNFLGAIWANESWGRYWGWDPKETWALISILIYACVIHLKYIPKFSSNFVLAWTSTLAFSSIIMTYLGVNYYLSGLHSYAAGDPMPIPIFIPVSLVIILSTIFFAYMNRRSLKNNI